MSEHDERPGDDALSHRLARLADEPPPGGGLDDLLRERTRRRASAALAAARPPVEPAWLRPLDAAWGKVGLPLFAAASVVLYLGWAIHTAAGLYR